MQFVIIENTNHSQVSMALGCKQLAWSPGKVSPEYMQCQLTPVSDPNIGLQQHSIHPQLGKLPKWLSLLAEG